MQLIVPAFDTEPWTGDGWLRGPTPHVAWSELACKNGEQYPTEMRVPIAVPLCREFEVVRATAGVPILIGSAYRPLLYNRGAGSFDTSQHPKGTALDLWTPRGLAMLDLVDIVIAAAKRPGGLIRGIGVYPWGVHMDIRRSDRIARWKGTRVSPEAWKKLVRET